jgi:hypothetical protein
MTYRITHWAGEMEAEFPFDRFPELLDELLVADAEHPDISVTHDSEWSLSVHKSGFLVLENLEEGEPTHCGPLSREEVLHLMVAVASGRLDEVRAIPWRAGYPPHAPP